MPTTADQSDIEQVGEVGKREDLAYAVAQSCPDALIVAIDEHKNPAHCGLLLGRYPELRILVFAPEQNQPLFYGAIGDIRSKSLEGSENEILNALLEAAPVVRLARV